LVISADVPAMALALPSRANKEVIMTETVLDTAVIGAGAAGLHVGRLLVDRGVSVELLDEHRRVGDSWRERYRSLRIFSPGRVSSLPGLPVDVGFFGYPTAEQMGDCLERYATRFCIPVRTGATVVALTKEDSGRFRLDLANGDVVLAQSVIVAAGAHRVQKRPVFADDLDPRIAQIDSVDYRGPEQLGPGPVLVVGAGNSGTDIALEAARSGHAVTIAGRHPGQVPVDVDTSVGNMMSGIFLRRLRHLTVETEKGRAAKDAHRGIMLVRNKLADLDTAGIDRVTRIESVVDGLPVTGDGTPIEASTVVWATGSRPDFSWIQIDRVLDSEGEPVHDRGVARQCPGLCFVGLDFQYSAASGALFGMGADAVYVVNALRSGVPAAVASVGAAEAS
jgi:putative flavoprotein involved in K+ transport